ncbi:MAG: GtrA family protein [Myxococcota bacterium]
MALADAPATMSPPLSHRLKATLLRLCRSWATRSLAVGAVASLIDIGMGVLCLGVFLTGTRLAAMTGVAVGAAFTFFANRYFAFREHNPKLASPALRFLLATGASMLLHGQLVVLLRDRLGVPFVAAKIVADMVVFTVGQLFVLRFFVFRKKRDVASPTSKRDLALEAASPVDRA